MSFKVLSITQLNNYVKSIIDGDINLNNVFVEGEISNFKNHYTSGHLYFSLKDEDSVIKCVMFSRASVRIKFNPSDSLRVVCRGKISVYPRDGQYQLYVEDMQPSGLGALALAYRQLKEKLEAEGLFSVETKRPLPKNPRRIAVLTSETGAAIMDILSIMERRNPNVEAVICPVIVQGENASKSIIDMLDKVYELSGIDIIILGRGGGSYEDLYCFNDEALVRKLYESPIPVISAIGHETDFTLCDFVADLRAPTPSAAAEIAVPDLGENLLYIKQLKTKLTDLVNYKINTESERFDRCISSVIFDNPKEVIDLKYKILLPLLYQFKSVCKNSLSLKEKHFATTVTALETLNPISVMARGYASVTKKGKPIINAKDIKVGEELNIRFHKGNAQCIVTKTKGE